jgi:hypothetical protein
MNTTLTFRRGTEGSTLVVTAVIVASIATLVAIAAGHSGQMARLTQRSRKAAVATEIADGHLEMLFSSWRNIYRTSWTTTSNNSGGTDYSLAGTNYFFTTMYNPGPAPTPLPYMSPSATPPVIQLPARSHFPADSAYTVTQYRIQAVDPMITLNADELAMVESGSQKGTGGFVPLSPAAIPPAAWGPNTWQYSFFYLAAVDVTVPTARGDVKAKVRRVFEKKFDQPWSYAMFFVDDLEFQPTSPFSITGPVHTNGSLYIGTSNFTATAQCEYGNDFVNGYSPKDPRYPGAGFTPPNFPQNATHDKDIPPSQVSPYLPFGWNLSLAAADTNANNDGYHEIIERPVAGADPLGDVRYYKQAGIKVLVAANGTSLTILDNTVDTSNSYGYRVCTGGGSDTQAQKNIFTMINNAIPTANRSQAIWDAREGAYVRLTTVDISRITADINAGTKIPGFNGVIYFADETPPGAGAPGRIAGTNTNVPTSQRAFRLVNGASIPTTGVTFPIYGVGGGLTVVSENPIYIQGNYNTGGANPPSNSNPLNNPTVNGYTRQPAAVVADAVNVLSGNWVDAKAGPGVAVSTRPATSTTINTAIVGGNVPSNGASYSGGGENFIRLQEDWTGQNFTYYGSMVQLYASASATGAANTTGGLFSAPAMSRWFYDDLTFSTESPPGNLQIAAYLQQQRWYQVY